MNTGTAFVLERLLANASSAQCPRGVSAKLAILADITAERQRQAELHPEAGEHDLLVMCAVLGEECGEVQKAALDLRWAVRHGDAKMIAARAAHLRTELVQVTAVAVKTVELHDDGRLVLDAGDLTANDPSSATAP